jgi:hypothetical protein
MKFRQELSDPEELKPVGGHPLANPWKSFVLRIFGGASIVILSFLTTLYVIDRFTTTVDPGTNREGGEYRSVIRQTITVEDCVAECRRDSSCQSWTLVRNGVLRPEMGCILKNQAAQPTRDACCTSGKVTRSIRTFFD